MFGNRTKSVSEHSVDFTQNAWQVSQMINQQRRIVREFLKIRKIDDKHVIEYLYDHVPAKDKNMTN